MRILITGNMGYVGPVVVAHLRRSIPGATLVGVDNGWFAHCMMGETQLPEVLLDEQWFRDVRDLHRDDLKGFDAVVHLAAVSNDSMGKRFETITEEINFRASVACAQAAAEAGVRAFVFASSCSVYGAAKDGVARFEESPLAPLTAYARSKIETEKALLSLQSPMTITCLRFATACGTSPRLRLDLVLNDFVASAVASRTVEVLSDGTPWRPLIHVDDMARAIEWALKRERDHGGSFLAINAGCNDWNFQIRDLAELVGRTIPGTRVMISQDAPADNRSYKVDFSLFKKIAPKHQPAAELETTIADLHQQLVEAEFNDPNFRNSWLIRLRVLNDLVDRGMILSDLRNKRPVL